MRGRPAPPAGARRPQAPARARTGRSGWRHVAHRRDRDPRGRRPARRGREGAADAGLCAAPGRQRASAARRARSVATSASPSRARTWRRRSSRSAQRSCCSPLAANGRCPSRSSCSDRSRPTASPTSCSCASRSHCPARTAPSTSSTRSPSDRRSGSPRSSSPTAGGPVGVWSSARSRTAHSHSMQTMPARSMPRPLPPPSSRSPTSPVPRSTSAISRPCTSGGHSRAAGGCRVNARLPVTTSVNDKAVSLDVEPRWTLAELLRDELRLTGTKVSCEIQVCGACTVLVDGRPVSSCTYLAADVDGHAVTTIEGLANADRSAPAAAGLRECFAFQCGFCTPGFLMMAQGPARCEPAPSREEIVEHLDGNMCRCTGYEPIVDGGRPGGRSSSRVRIPVAPWLSTSRSGRSVLRRRPRVGEGDRGGGRTPWTWHLPGHAARKVRAVRAGARDDQASRRRRRSKSPGVVAVVTSADLRACSRASATSSPTTTILAIGKVRYYGEPVALVLAETLVRAGRCRRAGAASSTGLAGVVDVAPPGRRLAAGARGGLRPRGRLVQGLATPQLRAEALRQRPPTSRTR